MPDELKTNLKYFASLHYQLHACKIPINSGVRFGGYSNGRQAHYALCVSFLTCRLSKIVPQKITAGFPFSLFFTGWTD